MRKNAPKTDALAQVMQRYAVAVTDEVMETINPDDPADPVARQYLPLAEELNVLPQENADPIGDDAYTPVKGIVHRYPDRVLLKPVHVCSVYCRFCFRRERVGPGAETLTPFELTAAIDYIRTTQDVWEVILTGGDPLVLSPRRLGLIMAELEKIDHVKIIRLHTRVPVANPGRVTPELIAALESRKAVYAVLHCNHANELTDTVRAATQMFIAAGIPLLSQSTLLKGVNDDPDVLEKLFRTLTEMKIKPYYLHHPDLAPGTSHFRLPLSRGQDITALLRGKLSGIAQPAYVIDIPGGFGKVPAGKNYVEKYDGGHVLTDPQGQRHDYPDETA